MNRQWRIFLFVLVLSIPAIYWLPWWTSAILGFLAVLIFQKGASRQSFWIPGIAGALAWVAFTVWQDILNQQILSEKIAHLFSLPSPYMLWLIEGFLGYITTGLGGWLAGSFKKEHHHYPVARSH